MRESYSNIAERLLATKCIPRYTVVASNTWREKLYSTNIKSDDLDWNAEEIQKKWRKKYNIHKRHTKIHAKLFKMMKNVQRCTSNPDEKKKRIKRIACIAQQIIEIPKVPYTAKESKARNVLNIQRSVSLFKSESWVRANHKMKRDAEEAYAEIEEMCTILSREASITTHLKLANFAKKRK